MGKKENAIIRRIVVTHLDTRDHRDKLYLLDDVATLFGLAVNCSGDITKIVRAAFAEFAGGKGGYTYNVPLEDMALSSKSILYSMRSRPTPNSPWNVVVGCFAKETLEELKEEEEKEEVIVPNRINIGLHEDASDKLAAALEKKPNGKTSAAADDVEDSLNEVLERNNALEKELERVKAKLEELEGAASLVDENERARTPPRDAGLTNLQIGNGIPSNEMIKNHEFKQAAESYLTVCDEVSKSKYYTLATDGGNKKGLEHLAKVIYYAKVVPGENGSKAKLRFGKFCIDIDISGKKADEIADAIEKSLKRFSDYVEAECVGMTGDAGGGGAVQTVFRHLREKIASLRRQLRCLLHAYNNCLKIAICSAMGPSGMNQDTCSI